MAGRVHALTVRDVKLSEAGEVKLTATDFQTQAQLIVGGEMVERTADTEHISDRRVSGYQLMSCVCVCVCVCSEPAVEFTKPLVDQTVEEEATTTLECEVSRENAEVQWFREAQEIRKTKKYDLIIDGRKRALVIHNCTPDDAKMYTCDTKEFKTSCFLEVTRKDHAFVI